MKRNRFFAVGTVIILIMAVKMSPSHLPYTIYTNGLVMPRSEWTLSRAQNGNLISSLKDNRTNNLQAFSASVFQRGYQANFQLNPAVYHRTRLNKGDTVATMYSNQDEDRLIQLQGDLEVQQAELQVNNSGQKTADVAGQASQIALARQELSMQRTLTQRTEALYEESLVSLQEYQADLSKLRVRELNLKMAEANYQSVATGDKPQQLQVVKSRINSLQQQIGKIKSGLKDLTLVAPVSGTILLRTASVNPTEEVLLSVADNSAWVVLLPVSYLEREYIQLDQTIEIAITGTTQTTSGKIVGIDNTVQFVDGRQAFFVTALVEEKYAPLISGMLARITVVCQSITLEEHLRRSAKLLFVH